MKSSLVVLDFASWTADDAEDASSPAAKMIPPMLRRRLSPIGRAAASAAFSIEGALNPEIPLVFASRWGDLSQAYAQIKSVAAGLGASPAKFAMSVHNAVEALVSIASGHTGAQTAIAAGRCTAEAGFEAADLYLEEFEKVLLVVYDESAGEVGGKDAAHAAAMLVSRCGSGLMKLELEALPRANDDGDLFDDAGSSLDWIRWLRSDSEKFERSDCARTFKWTKSFQQ